MENNDKWDLVLFNDPMHSFEHVVKTLTKCIPEMDEQTAAKHAVLIHTQQRSVIFSGLKEHVEHLSDLVENELEERGEFTLPGLATEVIPNRRNKNQPDTR